MLNPTQDIDTDLLEAVTDPDHGRAAARELSARIVNGTTFRERTEIKAIVHQAITQGRPMPDGSFRKPGPRTIALLAKCWATMVQQDQNDVHHLEGSRLTVGHIDARPAQERIAELLAEVKQRISGNVGASGREQIDSDRPAGG